MIEQTVRDFLALQLPVPVDLEVPDERLGPRYVVVEKTGFGEQDHFCTATFAVQSYGPSLYEAAQLNDMVKAAMDRLIELDNVTKSQLEGDYNYTDREKKQYRYQAVYTVTHY